MLEQGGDAEDLLDHAKLEVFLDQVFVFTPKGKLISLPSGAMPLDFAYAVHSDVGDSCIGVKVNGELRPLRTALQNGDGTTTSHLNHGTKLVEHQCPLHAGLSSGVMTFQV